MALVWSVELLVLVCALHPPCVPAPGLHDNTDQELLGSPAPESQPFLLFSTHNGIARMDMEEDETQRAGTTENGAQRADTVGDWIHSTDTVENGAHVTLVDTGHSAHAMDFHWRMQLLFWTDYDGHTLHQASLNGSDQTLLVSGILRPSGLAVDWVHDRLYFTFGNTSNHYIIAVQDISSRKQGNGDEGGGGGGGWDTVAEREYRVWSLACDPHRELLYWTTGRSIERSSLDGSGMESLYQLASISCASTLALDTTEQLLYWIDQCHPDSTIHALSLNRHTHRVLFSTDVQTELLHGITVLGKTLYWATSAAHSIASAGVEGGEGRKVLSELSPVPWRSVRAVDSRLQPRSAGNSSSSGCTNCSSDVSSVDPTLQPTVQPTTQSNIQPTLQPSPQSSIQPMLQLAFTSSAATQRAMMSSSSAVVVPLPTPIHTISASSELLLPVSSDLFSPQLTVSVDVSVSILTSVESSFYSDVSSVDPTLQPTVQPTTQSNIQPTFQPTLQPSIQPTIQPTLQPSPQPSIQPTHQLAFTSSAATQRVMMSSGSAVVVPLLTPIHTISASSELLLPVSSDLFSESLAASSTVMSLSLNRSISLSSSPTMSSLSLSMQDTPQASASPTPSAKGLNRVIEYIKDNPVAVGMVSFTALFLCCITTCLCVVVIYKKHSRMKSKKLKRQQKTMEGTIELWSINQNPATTVQELPNLPHPAAQPHQTQGYYNPHTEIPTAPTTSPRPAYTVPSEATIIYNPHHYSLMPQPCGPPASAPPPSYSNFFEKSTSFSQLVPANMPYSPQGPSSPLPQGNM